MRNSRHNPAGPVTGIELGPAGPRILSELRRKPSTIPVSYRGRTAAVLEDIRIYRKRLRRLELIEAVVRGLRAAEKGQLLEHGHVMRRLKKVAIG